ncbi:MAG: hypothetical protein AB8G15_12510 [Saprospiraceae bacterium]
MNLFLNDNSKIAPREAVNLGVLVSVALERVSVKGERGFDFKRMDALGKRAQGLALWC